MLAQVKGKGNLTFFLQTTRVIQKEVTGELSVVGTMGFSIVPTMIMYRRFWCNSQSVCPIRCYYPSIVANIL